jgi:hypothetical protein
MKKRRAFTLILVLGFAAALLVLIFILGMQGQSLSSLIRSQESRLDRRLASLDTAARVGILLTATSQQRPPSRVTGPAALNGTFSNQPYGLSQSSGRVDWNRESVHYPLPSQPCSFDNLFGDQLPSVGYQDELLKKASNGQAVAPGHSLLNQQFNRASSLTVFDHNFPYAAYAPSGEVQLQQVVSFHNPTFDESEGKLASPPDPLQYASGLPVLVRAKGAVQVDQFSCGRALSENGPIQVQGGALGFSGDLAEDQFCKNLSSQTSQAMDQLRDGALNKSKWIAGDFLSFEGVVALFKGKSGAAAKILSVQQACSFPFPPFPIIQEDAFITVLLIHHPWPADFTGTASDQQDIDEMKSLGDQVKALQSRADRIGEQVKKLLPQRDDLKQQLKQPDLSDDQKEALQKQLDDLQSQIDADQGQISDLDEQISDLKAKIKEKQTTIDKKSKEVWNGLPGSIPNNAWEDAGQPTGSSWAYVIVGEALVKSIFKALGGDIQSLLQTLVPPVRLVHLGSVDPEWQFHSDKTWPYPGKQGYVMKATVNVPPGKTMKLSGEYDVPGQHIEIQGDLWIQKGATCFVDGNLHVTKPDTWTDLAGVAKSPLMPGQEGTSDDDFKPTPVGSESPDGSTNPLYPWGRIILEEGATLVVSVI